MKNNKTLMEKRRGVFYSVITLMLLAPLVAYSLFYLETTQTNVKEVSVKIRADELSHYTESAELDLERFMRISSKNALIALVKYEEDHNASVSNASCILSSLSYYGNVSNQSCTGTTLSANISLPTNNTFLLYWINRTVTAGAKFGFNTNISLQNASFNMSNSFNVSYTLVMQINSTEKSNLMNFSKTVSKTINSSIINLDDPLFLSKTQGLIRRSITTSNATQGGTNLSAFVRGKYYRSSENSSSFLDRLEGRTRLSGKYGNTTGIETFVYGPELESYDLQVKNQSSIDFQYFNESLPIGQGCTINEMSCDEFWWFKMDSSTANKYGVTPNCTKCPT
ncbi:MAG: hypothetical protein ACE5DI_00120 [Candidatus Micrarchaeia archaeon]